MLLSSGPVQNSIKKHEYKAKAERFKTCTAESDKYRLLQYLLINTLRYHGCIGVHITERPQGMAFFQLS